MSKKSKSKNNKMLMYAGIGIVAFILLMSVFGNVMQQIMSISVQLIVIIILSAFGVLLTRPESIKMMATLAGVVALITLGTVLAPFASNTLALTGVFLLNIVNIIAWFVEALIVVAVFSFLEKAISGD